MSRFGTLSGRKWSAAASVDEAAGRARLRYITDVPGQQAVYMVKLAQALAYADAAQGNPGATVPPYIAAEAAATGQAALDVAQTVITLGAAWNEQIGPAIEGARLGGKAAVLAATTSQAVESARLAAVTALDAL